jgi:succinate dehydrogenase / fumarate reductase cytochrome b subunit
MSTHVSHYFCSSVGRKQLVAITGLSLCGFLVSHLLGNFTLLMGPDSFNMYAHKLISMKPFIYIAEIGLVGIFLLHLGLAMKLEMENRAARGGQKYYMKTKTGRGASFMSSTMPYTGLILLAFVISHLIHFKYGAYYETTVDGIVMRDLYKLCMEYFTSAVGTLWYVVAMLAATVHTAHGFSSAFQSLGLNFPKYFPCIKKMGYGYAIFVGGGFAFISIWAHLKGV